MQVIGPEFRLMMSRVCKCERAREREHKCQRYCREFPVLHHSIPQLTRPYGASVRAFGADLKSTAFEFLYGDRDLIHQSKEPSLASHQLAARFARVTITSLSACWGSLNLSLGTKEAAVGSGADKLHKCSCGIQLMYLT